MKRIIVLVLAILMMVAVPVCAEEESVDLSSFLGQMPTKKELKLVKEHPKQATKVYKCSQEAIMITKLLYGESGQDDNSDAFRHCLWNALMTKEIGKKATKKWANAHEYGKKGKSTKMDKHNNSVGRKLDTEKTTLSIVLQTRKAVKNGKCKRINKKGKLVKTNGKGMKSIADLF